MIHVVIAFLVHVCVLFARSLNLHAATGLLVKTPLTNFQEALELFKKDAYNKRAVHVVAFEVKVMTCKQPSIRHRLDEEAQQPIDTNQKKLQSITEMIILCGHQNIPFMVTETAP